MDIDVKSLFKAKKKVVKAVKIATTEEVVQTKIDEDLNPADIIVESESVSNPVMKIQETADFKASEEALKKTNSGWGSSSAAQVVSAAAPVIAEAPKQTKYVPPSRLTEKPKQSDMPTLSEALARSKSINLAPAKPSVKVVPTVPSVAAASKEEKEERRRRLQEEISRTSSQAEEELPADCKIAAAPFERIAAKYVNRPKVSSS